MDDKDDLTNLLKSLCKRMWENKFILKRLYFNILFLL